MSRQFFVPIIIAVALIFGGGGFYAGMKYAEGKSTSGITQGDFQNFRNLTPQQRQQRMQQLGINGNGFRIGNGRGGGFVAGDITAKDDKSITVKSRDGNSIIVFLSGSTAVTKSASGVLGDLEVGKTVTVNGTTNQDGSYSAQSIQIR